MLDKQNFGTVAGVIGLLLGIAGFVVFSLWPEPAWIYVALELFAVFHLSVFLVTYGYLLREFSSRRSTRFGANSFLMTAVFLGILLILNFILARHHVRIDLSGSGKFSLSPQTVGVLKNLKKEVKITGFFGERSEVADTARDLFATYRHYSPKITFETVNPDKKPTIAKEFGITAYDTVVLQSGGQSLTAHTVSEQEITSSIIRISRETHKTIYFVEGHGEHPVDSTEQEGFSAVKKGLEDQGMIVQKLSLLSVKRLPDDASVVILGGPSRPLAPQEEVLLSDYLAQGGRLFLLSDALSSSDLAPFALKWGIKLNDDLVLDPTSGVGPVVPIVNPSGYPPHPITHTFSLASFYPTARSVDGLGNSRFTFQPLLRTSDASWLTKQITGDISIDPSRDQKGPIVIGGVVEEKQDAGEAVGGASNTAPKMRIVVIGDSDFASNGLMRSAGNGDLFQNVVTWLADEGDLISIRPQKAETATLLISPQRMMATFYFSVLILPVGVLLTGLLIWRRRRRL